jgi:hypothetical protein
MKKMLFSVNLVKSDTALHFHNLKIKLLTSISIWNLWLKVLEKSGWRREDLGFGAFFFFFNLLQFWGFNSGLCTC